MLISCKILLGMKIWKGYGIAYDHGTMAHDALRRDRKKWRIVFLFFFFSFLVKTTLREFKTNTVIAASTRI